MTLPCEAEMGGKDPDELLRFQREDPLAFWLERAYELSVPLRLNADSLLEGRGMVIGALGEEWVRATFSKQRDGILGAYHGHPIVRSFGTADDNDIILILELAVYLKTLANAPSMEKVIPSLRSEGDFDSTLLQLAYAYRFRKIGASVSLEPDTAAGRRGDIRLGWEGKTYIVECYRERSPDDPLKSLFAFTVPKLLRRSEDSGKLIRILLRFFRFPTEEERILLQRAALKSIRTLDLNSTDRIELDFAHLEIQEISDQPETDFQNGEPIGEHSKAHHGMVLGHVAGDTALRPLSPGLTPMVSRSRAFCWGPLVRAVSPDERAGELYNKIASKLAQARVNPGGVEGVTQRIVIAQVAEGRELEAQRDTIMSRVHQRLQKGHRNVAAAIITSRRWTTKCRYQYLGSLLGVEPDPILNEIYNQIGQIEYPGDLIQDL